MTSEMAGFLAEIVWLWNNKKNLIIYVFDFIKIKGSRKKA